MNMKTRLARLFAVIVVISLVSMSIAPLEGNSTQAQTGYITSFNIIASSQTDHWQGYYGALSLSSNVTEYPEYFNSSTSNVSSIRYIGLNISSFSPGGYIGITSSTSLNVSGLQAGDTSTVDAITGTGSDSGTNTFNTLGAFYAIPNRGNITDVPTANINGFREGLLRDEDADTNVFVVPVVETMEGYNGVLCNFQFILPTNYSEPITYYMYYLPSPVVPSPSCIIGRITWSNNNTGLPGVSVNVTNTTTMEVLYSTLTNETGDYCCTNIDPGVCCCINAAKLCYWDNATTVTVAANDTIRANLTLWLKGDLNNNGQAADAGDMTLMNRAVLWEILGNIRWDLNENGRIADAGDLVLMTRAVLGEIVLI
jgi:hypothetical protein